jgi:hypothetical protein
LRTTPEVPDILSQIKSGQRKPALPTTMFTTDKLPARLHQ